MRREIYDEFRLGSARVSMRLGQIQLENQVTEISPKTLQVLQCLLDAGQNRVVSQAKFVETVWNDNYGVGGHGLRDAIWELRKALGDKPKAPRVIKTHPRKGYELLVSPQPVDAQRRWTPTLTQLAPAASAAVAGLVVVAVATQSSQPNLEPQWQGDAPSITADQTRVAFTKDQAGQQDLFIGDGRFEQFGDELVPGPDPAIVTLNQVTHSKSIELSPVWAPNSRDLAFIEYEPQDGNCLVKVFRDQYQRIDTLADNCFVITAPIGEIPEQLAWSPDGSKLAYQTQYRPETSSIAVIGLSDSDLLEIDIAQLTAPDVGYDAFPRWSGSNELAFIRLQDSMMALGQVHVLDPQGDLRLRCEAAPTWGLTWADDRYLAVTAAIRNPFNLWLVDTLSGQATRTDINARYLQSSAIDNRVLIDRYQVELPTQSNPIHQDSPPTTVPGVTGAIDFSLATNTTALVTRRDGRQRLVLRGPEQDREIFAGFDIYRPRFSRSGNKLAWSARDSTNENMRAYAMDLTTEAIVPLSDERQATFFAEWSPNEDAYLALLGVPTPLGSRAELVKIDLATGHRAKIASDASLQVVFDDSGSLWWSNDRGDVFRHQNDTTERIHQLDSVYDMWTVDRRDGTLYVTQHHAGTATIARVGRSGVPQVVKRLKGHLDPIVGLTLGPENSVIYRRNGMSWQQRLAVDTLPLIHAAQTNRADRSVCETLPSQISGVVAGQGLSG